MQRELEAYLGDIQFATDKIKRYITGMTKEELEHNEMALDAVVRNLEVIGEAVKKISDDIRGMYPEIPWKKIAGIRDILIHEYFGINMNIIWDVVVNKLNPLNEAVEKIKDDFQIDKP